jgi:hypothetical protein
MEGIDEDKYWSKRPPWKQPKYDRDKKSHEAMQNRKSALHVASRGEWQLDYEIQGELCQYYSTTQRELYGEKYRVSSYLKQSALIKRTISKETAARSLRN